MFYTPITKIFLCLAASLLLISCGSSSSDSSSGGSSNNPADPDPTTPDEPPTQDDQDEKDDQAMAIERLQRGEAPQNFTVTAINHHKHSNEVTTQPINASSEENQPLISTLFSGVTDLAFDEQAARLYIAHQDPQIHGISVVDLQAETPIVNWLAGNGEFDANFEIDASTDAGMLQAPEGVFGSVGETYSLPLNKLNLNPQALDFFEDKLYVYSANQHKDEHTIASFSASASAEATTDIDAQIIFLGSSVNRHLSGVDFSKGNVYLNINQNNQFNFLAQFLFPPSISDQIAASYYSYNSCFSTGTNNIYANLDQFTVIAPAAGQFTAYSLGVDGESFCRSDQSSSLPAGNLNTAQDTVSTTTISTRQDPDKFKLSTVLEVAGNVYFVDTQNFAVYRIGENGAVVTSRMVNQLGQPLTILQNRVANVSEGIDIDLRMTLKKPSLVYDGKASFYIAFYEGSPQIWQLKAEFFPVQEMEITKIAGTTEPGPNEPSSQKVNPLEFKFSGLNEIAYGHAHLNGPEKLYLASGDNIFAYNPLAPDDQQLIWLATDASTDGAPTEVRKFKINDQISAMAIHQNKLYLAHGGNYEEIGAGRRESRHIDVLDLADVNSEVENFLTINPSDNDELYTGTINIISLASYDDNSLLVSYKGKSQNGNHLGYLQDYTVNSGEKVTGSYKETPSEMQLFHNPLGAVGSENTIGGVDYNGIVYKIPTLDAKISLAKVAELEISPTRATSSGGYTYVLIPSSSQIFQVDSAGEVKRVIMVDEDDKIVDIPAKLIASGENGEIHLAGHSNSLVYKLVTKAE